MRLIDADELLTDRRKTKYYHLPNKDIAVPIIDIEHAHTVNAIPIPDGTTNRDVIREIWHDETLLSNIEYCYGKEWLNAPYEGGKEMTYKDEIKEKLMAYFKSWDGTKNTNELCEEICEILSEKSYEDGLNDAWECARKIMLCEAKGGFSTDKYTEIFGNIATFQALEILSASEAIAKIKEYEDKQKKNCSVLNDTCPYDIPCAECEVHCSIARARQKLKGDKE